MGDGAESVSGVEIAVPLLMGDSPPQAFAFTGGQNFAEVVEISSLAVRDRAKKSVMNHGQDHHLGLAIAAVLQNDAVLARGF